MRKIWNSAIYQGKANMKHYFEGWYFKIVDKMEENIYAIIAGVSFDKKGGTTHALIQVINGKEEKAFYFKYDVSEFWYSKKEFEVKVGNSFFSLDKIKLDIKDKELKVQGELTFEDIKPWPVKFFSPGVMGPLSFIPFMKCYHGLLSFDHSIKGKLVIDNKEIDFTGGRSYIEKDYGKSFPNHYIWMQTNHFDEKGTSLFASIAGVRWLGRDFRGFVVGFLYKNKLYKFASYNNSKIIKRLWRKNEFIFHLNSKRYRLEIDAVKTQGIQLPSPAQGAIVGRVSESLTSRIHVRLTKRGKIKGNILFEGTGRNAGIEIGGKINKLLIVK